MLREYSLSLISLLKGIVYDHQREVWDNLIHYEPEVKKYFAALGLDVWLDRGEGYAYLQQKELEDGQDVPKIAEKRQLNFHVSLLCLIIRKYLLEQDAQGGMPRPMIYHQDIVSRMKLFLPEGPDEAKQEDKILTTINRVIEIGFLRKVEDGSNSYEIHRIIKGFVNADVIDDTLKRLENYAKEKDITD